MMSCVTYYFCLQYNYLIVSFCNLILSNDCVGATLVAQW